MVEAIEKSRRSFIKSLSIGSCFLNVIPTFAAAAAEESKNPTITLQDGDSILFQGDSITYWYRKLDAVGYNNTDVLGSGYALLTSADLLYRNPHKNLKIFNKGISGNTILDLAARWDADCLSLKPDVLSILIGVNDYSLKMRNNESGTAETFKEAYQRLLDGTIAALPGVKLIIAEPFAIKGLLYVTESWFPGFDKYRQVAKEIAEKYKAVFIPLHSIFDKAQSIAPASYWSGDGIHPTLAGAKLMAESWLKAFKK